jgi:hypothetical protein
MGKASSLRDEGRAGRCEFIHAPHRVKNHDGDLGCRVSIPEAGGILARVRLK